MGIRERSVCTSRHDHDSTQRWIYADELRRRAACSENGGVGV